VNDEFNGPRREAVFVYFMLSLTCHKLSPRIGGEYEQSGQETINCAKIKAVDAKIQINSANLQCIYSPRKITKKSTVNSLL
jgi:hypothetical protein